MKIYDISQKVFGCEVYPGDPVPSKVAQRRIAEGDSYNLTSFTMCAHNGTHIDAPYHFIEGGDTVEAIPLEKTVGYCYLTEQSGVIGGERAEQILEDARKSSRDCSLRILIGGDAILSAEGARVFAQAGVLLLGVEHQTVGPPKAPMEVHKILLGAGTVLLEGLRLSHVAQGAYLLSAAPLALNGCDGAPCRAILIEE